MSRLNGTAQDGAPAVSALHRAPQAGAQVKPLAATPERPPHAAGIERATGWRRKSTAPRRPCRTSSPWGGAWRRAGSAGIAATTPARRTSRPLTVDPVLASVEAISGVTPCRRSPPSPQPPRSKPERASPCVAGGSVLRGCRDGRYWSLRAGTLWRVNDRGARVYCLACQPQSLASCRRRRWVIEAGRGLCDQYRRLD